MVTELPASQADASAGIIAPGLDGTCRRVGLQWVPANKLTVPVCAALATPYSTFRCKSQSQHALQKVNGTPHTPDYVLGTLCPLQAIVLEAGPPHSAYM